VHDVAQILQYNRANNNKKVCYHGLHSASRVKREKQILHIGGWWL